MAFEPDQPVESAPVAGGGFVPDPEPSKTLPANAGLVKLITGAAGIPVDTVENVINLGVAGANRLLDRGGESTPPLSGSVGSSKWFQDKLRSTGIPALSPDNPTPQSGTGTFQYDLVSRGGVLPGGAIPAVSSIVAEKAGGPEWASVGAMAPSAAVAGYNRLRAPSLQREQAHNAVRDDTWKDAQAAGYVVPPSHVRSTFMGNRAESVGGKAALNQEAIDRNQVVTDNLARRAAGLPENAKITVEALEQRRNVLSQPYRDVSGMSPLAAQALQRLRDARAEARVQWDHYERQRVPDAQRAAQAADRRAEMLERVLEREAARHGRPDLIPQLREARTNIAKTWDVERALNRADGHVDPQDLARAYDRGAPLSGELATIAKFSLAFPQASKAASRNPTPGVSALEPHAAAGLGLAGASSAPAGWLAGGVPLLAGPTRGLLLSDIYQRLRARPDYSPNLTPEGSLQSLARTAILENERARK